MKRYLVVLVLVLAGCGGNSNPDVTAHSTRTPKPARTATAAPTQTQTASAAPTESATPAAGATEAPSTRCTSSQLTATVHFGEGAGAAGHIEGALLLTNKSGTACTLHGYPGVSFVDAAGQQIGAAGERTGAGTIPTVTVDPGQQAGAQLQLTDLGVYDPSECKPTDANGLRVYPPDERAALFAPYKTQACQGDEKTITIGPMVALADLPEGLL